MSLSQNIGPIVGIVGLFILGAILHGIDPFKFTEGSNWNIIYYIPTILFIVYLIYRYYKE